MRTDLWTLMRGGIGGGSGGGSGSGSGSGRAYSGQTKDPSTGADESLHLRPDSIAFTPSLPSAVGSHERPRGPPPPPPPAVTTPTDPHTLNTPPVADRRSQPTIALPRRSILAPEGMQEDEDKDDEDHHKPKRTRSRILSELRPVASPREAAEISTPISVQQTPQLEPPPSPPRLWLPDEDDAGDGDYYACDANGSPSSARCRAFDIFASRRVRLQHRWRTDLWIFMKNDHPVLALCAAHRWHPFRKLDRVLVLLVALATALLVSGIVATRPCCSTASPPLVTTPTPTASFPPLPLSVSNATAGSAAVSCACGLAHTSGLVALAIAAVVPLTILLLEPLVTLYHDTKLFGCAVRVRRGRVREGEGGETTRTTPSNSCCSYRPDGLAARVGRAFVLVLLVALAFAVGVVAARMWDEDAAVDVNAVLVEWAVIFVSAAALGLFGFCSAVWLALFAVRWWGEGRAAKNMQNASVLVHQWAVPPPNREVSPV